MGFCERCKHQNEHDICYECVPVRKSDEVPTMFLPRETEDNVNHPAHYETGKFECIEVMTEVFGDEATQDFCLLNAFKYLYRCNHKNNKAEDIKKANWYINKYIELEGVKNGKS